MKKKIKLILLILFIIFCTLILSLSVRGLSGNPNGWDVNRNEWKDDGPFELSPERGRFALTYSLIEDKSFYFSEAIARFAIPDLGYKDGHYVSLFAPGVSFLVSPGYLIGRYFGVSQVGTFALISVIAILNVLLIRAIAVRLGANAIAATIGSLVFLFATPAFSYAVTLYQHHISVFLFLLSVYILIRFKNIWFLSIIWFLAMLSISVDYPNFFMVLPIALFALAKMINIKKFKEKLNIKIKLYGILTFFAAVLPLAFFLWFNMVSYGSPFQLAGTVASVKDIDNQGKPIAPRNASVEDARKFTNLELQDKQAVNFFKTRNMLEGFYIYFFSPDRGVIFYTPVILFGILGIILSINRKNKYTNLLLSVLAANVVLYSMWGDFWGGWAFGSRYLIPSYAILAVFIALLLTYWRNKTVFLICFFIILAYSIAVNTLGAVTSNRNPPQVEVLGLEKVSGRQEKYTYERNMDFLSQNKSKSFVFQSFAKNYLSALQYYIILVSIISATSLILLISLRIFYRSESI